MQRRFQYSRVLPLRQNVAIVNVEEKIRRKTIMANKMNAIGAYRPRIKLGKRIERKDLVIFIARSSNLNESGISQTLLELRDAIIFFNLRGIPVRLEGLGTFYPTIDLDGNFGIGYRPDIELKNAYNAPGAFQGDIENRDMIGMTLDDLIIRWNEEHPEDPIVL